MIGNIQNAQARSLCFLAQADESALLYPLPDHMFGFAAQQSCEKLLKALLTALDVRYPRTHNLRRLAALLRAAQESQPATAYNLLQLTPFGVEMRYTLGRTIQEDERNNIRVALEVLREHVIGRILEIETRSRA